MPRKLLVSLPSSVVRASKAICCRVVRPAQDAAIPCCSSYISSPLGGSITSNYVVIKWTPASTQGHRHIRITQGCVLAATLNRMIRRLCLLLGIFKVMNRKKSRLLVGRRCRHLIHPFFMVSYIVSSASGFNGKSQDPNTHPSSTPSRASQTISHSYAILHFFLHEVCSHSCLCLLAMLGMHL